jgi:lipocalin
MMRWFMELEPWQGALAVTIAIFAFAALVTWVAGDLDLPPLKGHWMMIGKVPIFFPDNDDDKDD